LEFLRHDARVHRPLVAFFALALGCSSGGLDDVASDAEPLPIADAAFDGATDAASKDAHADAGDARGSDAATDARTDAEVSVGCGEFTGDADFTCSKDGMSRGRCVGGSADVESCARGCLRVDGGPDVCLGTTSSWSCTGTVGTEKSTDGDYYLTGFGCWTDASGTIHTDPGDDCIPGCLAKAHAAGLCDPSMDGPACEEHVNWYTADSARFGCLARVRITEPKSGKSVIAVVLDSGPACWVEAKVSHAILDASDRVDVYLFGGGMGYADKALVHVVEVDPATPLGPE